MTAYKEDAMDTLGARIMQASGTLTMVLADGEGNAGFRHRHDIVVNSLWAVDELLKQAKQALDALSEELHQEHLARTKAA